MQTQTNVFLPSGMKVEGKTRLDSIQQIMSVINETPNLFRISSDMQGRIALEKLPNLENSEVTPFVAGRMPRTSTPQDLYPISIERDEGATEFFNVVTITNTDETLKVQVPETSAADYPLRPIHRVVKEKNITTADQARLIGRQMLVQQGRENTRWEIEALPERFDIRCGDIVEFASSEAGLAGRQMVFNMSWTISPDSTRIKLTVGKPQVSLLASLRYASNLSI